MACLFGEGLALAVESMQRGYYRRSAQERLREVVDEDFPTCLATSATQQDPKPEASSPPIECHYAWDEVAAVMMASGQPKDDRPCRYCGDDQHQESMILCDRCEACYHKDCAKTTGGT